MITWEYRVEVIYLDNYTAALNAIGAEGWELVLAESGRHVFKRPKPPTPMAKPPAKPPPIPTRDP